MQVPLAVPDLSGREAEYLQECVRSTFVSSAGPFVARFEEQIAELSGSPTAVATCAGTVALQMSLVGLGIGRGDLVMVPSLTFIASANAVRHTGSDVWLVDVDPERWTLDVDLAREVIERDTVPDDMGRRHRQTGQRLRAIMPVMIMGASLDAGEYVRLGEEYGLDVILDAAAAIGGSLPGGLGLAGAGVAAVCYSFNGNKTVTCGGGGAVASEDSALVDRIRHLISTGRVGRDYEHDVVAYNFRMTNVEAAIGVAQIERLPELLRRKREVHDCYTSLAGRYADLEAFPTPRAGRSTHWFSGVTYRGTDPDACPDFRRFMVDRGIDVRPFWKPVHLQAPYRDALVTSMGESSSIWERIVPLPCSSGISPEELEHVVTTATDFWDERSDLRRSSDG